MVAHARGRWESHTQWQLGEVWHLPQLAGRVFDAYLCVTEYVLHAGDPYTRLIGYAEELLRQAVQAGARRGEAFGATVLGEAQLLRGDAQAARGPLERAARISREVGAVAGEALARARLGEALHALGDRAGAQAQLEEALDLSHASKLAHHLLFLVLATQLRVQDDTDAALALVDTSGLLLADVVCNFCPLPYALAAGTVCARAGQPARADGFLERAERAASLWPPGVWTPALCELRGEILHARGAGGEATISLRRALEGYVASGQGLNERRVRATLATLPA
jgi:tetratricopeptide (TPR) repeat protein